MTAFLSFFSLLACHPGSWEPAVLAEVHHLALLCDGLERPCLVPPRVPTASRAPHRSGNRAWISCVSPGVWHQSKMLSGSLRPSEPSPGSHRHWGAYATSSFLQDGLWRGRAVALGAGIVGEDLPDAPAHVRVPERGRRRVPDGAVVLEERDHLRARPEEILVELFDSS